MAQRDTGSKGLDGAQMPHIPNGDVEMLPLVPSHERSIALAGAALSALESEEAIANLESVVALDKKLGAQIALIMSYSPNQRTYVMALTNLGIASPEIAAARYAGTLPESGYESEFNGPVTKHLKRTNGDDMNDRQPISNEEAVELTALIEASRKCLYSDDAREIIAGINNVVTLRTATSVKAAILDATQARAVDLRNDELSRKVLEQRQAL